MVAETTIAKGIDPTVIEPGILPLCDALNGLPGVKTLWSCHGHWGRQRPYVAFEAGQTVASAIDRSLRDAQYDGALVYNWLISGYFDANGTLLFSIRSNDIRIGHALSCVLHMRRQRLDNELRALAEIVLSLRSDSISQAVQATFAETKSDGVRSGHALRRHRGGYGPPMDHIRRRVSSKSTQL